MFLFGSRKGVVAINIKNQTLTMNKGKDKRYAFFAVAFAVLGFLFLAGQVIDAWHYNIRSLRVKSELMQLKAKGIAEEKLKQEIVKLRLENEQQAFFLRVLLLNVGSTIGALVALSGAWLGMSQYFTSRHNEQMDRLASELSTILNNLNDNAPSTRAAGVASLYHFLSPEKSEFHSRVASALALIARKQKGSYSDLIMQTLRPVLEAAMRNIPNHMRAVSWQGVRLENVDFSGLDLHSFDFRDSDLINIDFSGSDLSCTRFDAADCKGSCFDNTNLSHSILTHSDFSNCSARNADLRKSNLVSIRLMNTDIADANLEDTSFLRSSLDWRMARNWRDASFSDNYKNLLLDKFGPKVSGPKILMLLWEFYPAISGGVWTAAYHLIKRLRLDGADITVIVPWSAKSVSFEEFGFEINLIPLGLEISDKSDDEPTVNLSSYSSYGWMARNDFPASSYNTYSINLNYAGSRTLIELANIFAREACRIVDELQVHFDIIHAHDWVTFGAAASLSKLRTKPWIAHFHSIEVERQPLESRSNLVQRIEHQGCLDAFLAISPSKITRQRISDEYNVDIKKLHSIPNSYSIPDSVSPFVKGEFATSKVVFIGRLDWQKGPDIYAEIARQVHFYHPHARFDVYGQGQVMLDEEVSYVSHEMPSSQEFCGIGNQELVQGSFLSFLEFDLVVPISYSKNDSLLEEKIQILREPLDRLQAKGILDAAIKYGFSAYPIIDVSDPMGQIRIPSGGPKITHRIEIRTDSKDIHKSFYVSARGLDRAREVVRTEKILSLKGFLDWKKRQNAFENASLVIVPSRNEPFGMVVLEAMEAGVPVVYPVDSGVAEVVSAGLQVDVNDISGLVSCVTRVLEDQVFWNELVAGQLSALREYEKRKSHLDIIKLWESS